MLLLIVYFWICVGAGALVISVLVIVIIVRINRRRLERELAQKVLEQERTALLFSGRHRFESDSMSDRGGRSPYRTNLRGYEKIY